jgi:hypothetical protein
MNLQIRFTFFSASSRFSTVKVRGERPTTAYGSITFASFVVRSGMKTQWAFYRRYSRQGDSLMFANYHVVTGIVNNFVIANSAQQKEDFLSQLTESGCGRSVVIEANASNGAGANAPGETPQLKCLNVIVNNRKEPLSSNQI